IDCLYLPLGEYSSTEITENKQLLAITNDLDRNINQRLQRILHNRNCRLLNPHEGIGRVPSAERKRRMQVEKSFELVVADFEEQIRLLLATSYLGCKQEPLTGTLAATTRKIAKFECRYQFP
ncbi:MAG: hypothetical protein NTV34_16745, partial [Proteobacteria bacterium]|nr:hypothetical protein [Pseudomonadota bacterium]